MNPGIEIVGFGNIHFDLVANIVRCLNVELKLDVKREISDSYEILVNGRMAVAKRRVEIIPLALGSIVKLSVSRTPFIGENAPQRWRSIEILRVRNGHIEQVAPLTKH